MPLLCSNTQLDRAIERLDPVIARYPGLISARHARGTAHLRKWLNSVPIEVQHLRSGPLTYPARFGMAEAKPGADSLALYRARRDFAAILEREMLPHTQATLALLEAYAGNLSAAAGRAEQALRMAPEDSGVRNQLGVIRFLNGDVKAAASEFLHASRGVSVARPWVLFNRAKCAALLDDPAASHLLQQYLRLDPITDWRREVLELLGDENLVAGRIAPDPPPALAGISLCSPPDAILHSIGPFDREDHWRGLRIWSYDTLGLEVVLCPRRGLIHLELDRQDLGGIGGVSVGDSIARAVRRWGCPAESGEGQVVFWLGNWGVAVEHDGERRVVSLSLAGLD